jgi:hypothetical protein
MTSGATWTAYELPRRAIGRPAVEAAIWSIAAVGYERAGTELDLDGIPDLFGLLGRACYERLLIGRWLCGETLVGAGRPPPLIDAGRLGTGRHSA